jgi:hypothetical protein
MLACAGVACAGPAKPTVARSATCDVSGAWAGTATDPMGVEWTVTLVFHQAEDDVGGTAEWQGGDDRRHVEEVRGLVDCTTGAVNLRTVPPAEATAAGEAISTAYALTLAPDNTSVTGRFENVVGAPGTFSATRK